MAISLISQLVYVLASFFSPVSDYSYYGRHESKPELEDINKGNKTMFVFGDSLFDAGNNQYIVNTTLEGGIIWPYGEAFFHHPTGRLSDGRIVPDFIAEFANVPMLPPFLQPGPHVFTDGANFASAGSGVFVETQPGTLALPTQLSTFKAVKKLLQQEVGVTETKKLLRRAVYLFSIGGNDYHAIDHNTNITESEQTEFVGIVIRNLTTILKEIYYLGGRKIAFQNVGPLGCLPLLKARNPDQIGSDGCVALPSKLARLHNAALSNVLKELEDQLPGFKYSLFHYYDALADRVNNSTKYGFDEGKTACCGSGAYRGLDCGIEPYFLCSEPSKYVWFDGGHTTEALNLQIAELIWSGPPELTGPYNVKQLFGHA